jgi:hypothetical protein
MTYLSACPCSAQSHLNSTRSGRPSDDRISATHVPPTSQTVPPAGCAPPAPRREAGERPITASRPGSCRSSSVPPELGAARGALAVAHPARRIRRVKQAALKLDDPGGGVERRAAAAFPPPLEERLNALTHGPAAPWRSPAPWCCCEGVARRGPVARRRPPQSTRSRWSPPTRRRRCRTSSAPRDPQRLPHRRPGADLPLHRRLVDPDRGRLAARGAVVVGVPRDALGGRASAVRLQGAVRPPRQARHRFRGALHAPRLVAVFVAVPLPTRCRRRCASGSRRRGLLLAGTGVLPVRPPRPLLPRGVARPGHRGRRVPLCGILWYCTGPA